MKLTLLQQVAEYGQRHPKFPKFPVPKYLLARFQKFHQDRLVVLTHTPDKGYFAELTEAGRSAAEAGW